MNVQKIHHPQQSGTQHQEQGAHAVRHLIIQYAPHPASHAPAYTARGKGVPPNFVQKRLGDKQIQMSLDLYVHVLPSMDSDAAAHLGALLHGT